MKLEVYILEIFWFGGWSLFDFDPEVKVCERMWKCGRM
jgi:hypothetical protein